MRRLQRHTASHDAPLREVDIRELNLWIEAGAAQQAVAARSVGRREFTATLAVAATILSEVDGATWMAVSEYMMRSAVAQARGLPLPDREHGVRRTPGLAFAVMKPDSENVTSSAKVQLRSINPTVVAAWERDRITERGRLDNKILR